MTPLFEQLREPVEALRLTREKNFDRIRTIVAADGRTIEWGKYTGDSGQSLAELENRVIAVADITSPLFKDSDAGLIPLTQVAQFRTSLEQLSSQINSATAALDQLAANGNIATIPEDYGVLTATNGQATWNLVKWSRGVSNQVDAALLAWLPIAASRKVFPKVTSGAFLAEHERQIERNRADADTLRGAIASAQESLRALGASKTAAENSAAHAEVGRNEAEKLRQVINEYAAETAQKVASVRELTGQAETLAGTVQSYQSQFDQFQKALESREKRITEGETQHAAMIERLRLREAEVERLNSTAEEMLTGATVAGLASTFGNARDALTKEVRLARYGFYGSILVLGLSALPLAVYVIPGLTLAGVFGDAGDASDFEPGQVLMRFVLLIPALWLAKFTAARHAALFRLREHYAYKYSIAASVEGFKKQAPEFKEGIAAAAFHELTFNPANRMEERSSAEEHPNPIMDWFLRKIGATADGKRE
jgi:hypothetical protein